jgi:hypothetical protein
MSVRNKYGTSKFEPLHTMGTYKRNGVMAPLILNLEGLLCESHGLGKMSDKNKFKKVTNKRPCKGSMKPAEAQPTFM